MRAIVVDQSGGPEVLQIKILPDLVPGPIQVLLRVRAAGVNPVETYRRAGTHGYAMKTPYTPGSDGAGEVLSVGAEVKSYKPGDRVFTTATLTGSYAEQALCTENQIQPLPAELTFAQGAALGIPYLTAFRALFQRGAVQSGETVLIHGASGAVGMAAVQWAKTRNLTVIASGGGPEKIKFIQTLGASQTVDHRDENHFQAVLDLTHGRGVDLVLEMLANVNLGRDLGLLARGGRVVVIGSRGRVEIDPRDLMVREADIRGLVTNLATPEEKHACLQSLQDGIQALAISPVVTGETPLAQAPAAHEQIMQPAHYGKIVLVP
jgi:NADPH2:quinone reductase